MSVPRKLQEDVIASRLPFVGSEVIDMTPEDPFVSLLRLLEREENRRRYLEAVHRCPVVITHRTITGNPDTGGRPKSITLTTTHDRRPANDGFYAPGDGEAAGNVFVLFQEVREYAESARR